MTTASDKQIGQILLDKGYITATQLGKALKQQGEEEFRLLGQILMELGYITKEQLYESIAFQTV